MTGILHSNIKINKIQLYKVTSMVDNSSISTANSNYCQYSYISHQGQIMRPSSQNQNSQLNRYTSSREHLNTDPRQADEAQRQIIHSRLQMLKKKKQKVQEQICQQYSHNKYFKLTNTSRFFKQRGYKSKIKMLEKQKQKLQEQIKQQFSQQRCSKLINTSRSAKIKPKNQSVANKNIKQKKKKNVNKMSQKSEEIQERDREMDNMMSRFQERMERKMDNMMSQFQKTMEMKMDNMMSQFQKTMEMKMVKISQFQEKMERNIAELSQIKQDFYKQISNIYNKMGLKVDADLMLKKANQGRRQLSRN